MTVTAPERAVVARVDAEVADAFRKDQQVTVALPDGKETNGTVRSVSTEVKSEKTADGEDKATVAVDVGLDDEAAVGALDSGPVRIKIAGTARQGVLAVPVTALLALREGGYAVQTTDGKLLPVKTGLFAGGLVEVDGDGVAEGLKVVTTS
jgi:hypothetical protein